MIPRYLYTVHFNQQTFKVYITALQHSLFEDTSIKEILAHAQDSYRYRRFTYLYLIQDKNTFDDYYEKRKEFGLEEAFRTIITGLLQEKERQLELDIANILNLQEGMISTPQNSYSLKEFKKDLSAFLWYTTKRELIKNQGNAITLETIQKK